MLVHVVLPEMKSVAMAISKSFVTCNGWKKGKTLEFKGVVLPCQRCHEFELKWSRTWDCTVLLSKLDLNPKYVM